ncbi:MAG: hypothetical protein K0B01_14780, partial [Syntrophobacterales bacterium]|nr:hypothetical protein [Syntrophobacterales bacterium]
SDRSPYLALPDTAVLITSTPKPTTFDGFTKKDKMGSFFIGGGNRSLLSLNFSADDMVFLFRLTVPINGGCVRYPRQKFLVVGHAVSTINFGWDMPFRPFSK